MSEKRPSRLETVTAELNACKEDYRMAARERDKFRKDYEALEAECVQIYKTTETLKDSHNELLELLEAARNDLTILQTEHRRQEVMLADVRQDNEKFCLEVALLHKCNATLERERDEIRVEHAALCGELEVLERLNNYEELKEENVRLRVDLAYQSGRADQVHLLLKTLAKAMIAVRPPEPPIVPAFAAEDLNLFRKLLAAQRQFDEEEREEAIVEESDRRSHCD